MKNNKNYVMVEYIGKDFVKVYKHYKHPITGTLVNSGKKELVTIIKK